MAEYIEREALIACIEERQDEYSDIELSFNDMSRGEWNGLELAKERISSAPAADVVPVVHGRWKPILEGVWNLPTPICVGWSCSLCGRYEQYKEPYCNCGARMGGE